MVVNERLNKSVLREGRGIGRRKGDHEKAQEECSERQKDGSSCLRSPRKRVSQEIEMN